MNLNATQQQNKQFKYTTANNVDQRKYQIKWKTNLTKQSLIFHLKLI